MKPPIQDDKKGLIILVKFGVLSANYGSKAVLEGNNVFGPGYNSKLTGVVPYANFKVENKEVLVSELEFYGNISNIFSGDYIKAYIHKYIDRNGNSVLLNPEMLSNKSFVERDFRKKEIVSKIEKWNTPECEGKLLATFVGLERLLVERERH